MPEGVTVGDGVITGDVLTDTYTLGISVPGIDRYFISVYVDGRPILTPDNTATIAVTAQSIAITIRADGYETYNAVYTNSVQYYVFFNTSDEEPFITSDENNYCVRGEING